MEYQEWLRQVAMVTLLLFLTVGLIVGLFRDQAHGGKSSGRDKDRADLSDWP